MVDINEINGVKNAASSGNAEISPKESVAAAREYDCIIDGTSKANKIKKFGITHYRYKDCSPSKLTSVNKCLVHKDCAAAFKKMQADAKKDGCNLRIVSGYRSSEYQVKVFKRKFNGKYPSSEQMKERLKYSAPSGYSEHHTGLAIDINETETTFKGTKEYEWLIKNAKKFGFEISFPKNNAQGLGFEPWHWRFVGKDGQYKHVFEEARKHEPLYKKDYE